MRDRCPCALQPPPKPMGHALARSLDSYLWTVCVFTPAGLSGTEDQGQEGDQ